MAGSSPAMTATRRTRVPSRTVVVLAAAADRVRLVPEELAIARGGLGVLVDRQQDGLDVVIAPAFMDADAAHLGQRLDERRMIVAVAIPFERLAHRHFLPSKTFKPAHAAAPLSAGRARRTARRC